MSGPVTFPVYNAVYTTAATLAAPLYLARGLIRHKYLWNLADRLGRRDLGLGPKDRSRFWLHALSLGEVTAAAPLVTRLSDQGNEICLSTATRAGFENAGLRFPELSRFSAPFDLSGAVARTVDQVRPDLFILMETDIWPNLLARLHNQNVPAVWVNARVSPRSLNGYRKIKGFWGRVLHLFQAIGCQTDLDRERLLALGAPGDRLNVTGNLKFDHPRPLSGPQERQRLLEETGLPDGLWLVAGSTHPGEEAVMLDIFRQLKTSFPRLKMMVAPRNKRYFDGVWKMMSAASPHAARRTGPTPRKETDLFLLDTHGELDRFYELGDVVFVGKSLPGPGETGGHNLLEPAMRGKPVLYGPMMQNFPEIARLLKEAGGGRQVNDEKELLEAIRDWLTDEGLRKAAGQKGCQVTESHRGALDRTLALIDQASIHSHWVVP